MFFPLNTYGAKGFIIGKTCRVQKEQFPRWEIQNLQYLSIQRRPEGKCSHGLELWSCSLVFDNIQAEVKFIQYVER